jgi:hypothetical protein
LNQLIFLTQRSLLSGLVLSRYTRLKGETMDLYKLLLASALGFAVLNFFIIPQATRKWEANQSLTKISKAGLLGALSFARSFLLIAAVTYLVLALIVLILGFWGGATPAEFKAAAERIQGFRENLSFIQKYFVNWVGLFLIVGLAIVAYRREKGHIEAQLLKRIEQERARLQREAEEGRGESLPPSKEMLEIVAHVQQLQMAYDAIEFGRISYGPDNEQKKLALKNQIKKLRELSRTLDLERRINLALDLNGEPEANSKSGGKFKTFFLSKGFLASTKTASRSLTLAGTVLMILSLVGVSGSSVTNSLKANEVYWSDLHVAANQKKVLDSYDKLLRDNPPVADQPQQDEDKKEDDALLNHLARRFEQSLAKADLWRYAQTASFTNSVDRRNSIRSQILGEVRNSTSETYNRRWGRGPDEPPDTGGSNKGPEGPDGGGPKGGPNQPPNGNGPRPDSSGPTARGEERGNPRPKPANPNPTGDVKDPVHRTLDVPGPQTSAGKQFRKDIGDLFGKHKSLWIRVKAKVIPQIHEFAEPADVSDFSERAVGEFFGSLFDSTVESSGTELDKLASKLGKSAFTKSGKEMYELLSKQLVNDLAGDPNIADAYNHVRTLNRDDFPIFKSADIDALKDSMNTITKSNEYIRQAGDRSPALAISPADNAELSRAAEEFKSKYNSAKPVPGREFDAFATYDDIYPSQKTKQPTVRQRLVAEIQPSLIQLEPTYEANFARSRSYPDLVGHSRTGGVLIGRAADNMSQAGNIIDMRWNTASEGILLTLTRDDGKEFQIGPYRPFLIHQALAFVADGRPVAVTILNVNDAGPQRVFLHPAFVDSKLGQEMITLDRFVFDVMERDKRFTEARDRVTAQWALYEVAWLNRLLTLDREQIAKIEEKLGMPSLYDVDKLSEVKNELQNEVQRFEKILANAGLNKLAGQALRHPEELGNSDRSILARKPEFFEPALVQNMKTCAYSAAVANFSHCIVSTVSEELPSITKEKIKDWVVWPPSLHTLSGVRERSFSVTSDLSWLNPEAGNQPHAQLWPLDYTILQSFSSSPKFMNGGEDPAKYSDRNPWEFDELKPLIEEKVWRRIDSDPQLRSTYQDLREFTVLQRLFRIALDDSSWKNFPIEKLVGLTNATAQYYRYEPTNRWESRRQLTVRPNL